MGVLRMHVPFIDLGRSIQKVRTQILQDWERCLDQCEFVGGPTVKKLEAELAKTLECQNFVTCHSGTDAIVLGLQALGVTPGQRVAVPNMTFWAPYEAIVQIGAVPVLVDSDPTDLQMSFEEFCKGHEQFQFDAAIFVHLFGWTSGKLRQFREYCQKKNIKLVEDGAQSFGVRSEGEAVYANADVATISFYPAKVLGAAGDAGGVAVRDPKVADMVRTLGNHGRAGHYTYDYVGWNSRMGGLQATFLYHMLQQSDEMIASRMKAFRFYQSFLADHQDVLTFHQAPQGVEGNGYLTVITCKQHVADKVVQAMNAKGVSCGRTYPQTLDMQPPAAHTMKTSDLKHSRLFSQSVINLPLFAGITENECEYAAKTLIQVLKA